MLKLWMDGKDSFEEVVKLGVGEGVNNEQRVRDRE